MALDPRLLAILACPDDKGPLLYLGDGVGEAVPHTGARQNHPRASR